MINAALDECFDAVVDAEQWPSAMQSLANALGVGGVSFHPKGIGADRVRVPASSAYRDLLSEMFADGWQAQDVRAKRGWPLAEQGRTIILERDLSTPEERRRLPIYADLFARHDLAQFASLIFNIDGQHWAVNAVRSEDRGEFIDPEVAILLALRPRLARLFRFASRLSWAAGQGALTAFTLASTPAILLNWRGLIVDVNEAAEPLMGQDLDIKDGRLRARDIQSGRRLEALVEQARGPDGRGGVTEIARQNGRPLIAETIPIRNKLADAFNLPAILVLINEPSTRQTASHAVLRTVFHLTPREVEVADRLCRGHSSGEISQQLGLQPASVRQVIKSILLKTDTTRQADLVSLMARFPKRSSSDD